MAAALPGPQQPKKGCSVSRQAGTHGIGKYRREHCVLESKRGVVPTIIKERVKSGERSCSFHISPSVSNLSTK
nr:unnamed protein product [Callosobruchus chinensis]